MKRFIIAAFISLAGVFTVSCLKEEKTGDVKAGDTVPDFVVTLSDGSVFDSSKDFGWTLICFFNTDCGDCRDELPVIQDVHDRLVDIKVVAISRREGEASVKSFFDENSYTFPYHADGGDGIYRLFASSVIPRCYLCKDGVVTACWDDSPVMRIPDIEDYFN